VAGIVAIATSMPRSAGEAVEVLAPEAQQPRLVVDAGQRGRRGLGALAGDDDADQREERRRAGGGRRPRRARRPCAVPHRGRHRPDMGAG
jgi:hypothetical protein